MSGVHQRVDLDSLASPVCEFCSGYIEDRGQDCPALDEDGLVTYVLVDRDLGYQDGLQVPSERAAEFLHEFHTERGIYEWDAEARGVLCGSKGGQR